MVRTTGKGSGSNAQLVKDNRELERELERVKYELRNRPPSKLTNKRVYADQPITEFNPHTKQSFIDSCRSELTQMFIYVSKNRRRQKKAVWEAVCNVSKDVFEDWTIMNTGNRWLIKSVSLKESTYQNGNRVDKMPSEDFIEVEFTHKGHLRYMLNDKGLNIIDQGAPPVVDLYMTVRVHRFELD